MVDKPDILVEIANMTQLEIDALETDPGVLLYGPIFPEDDEGRRLCVVCRKNSLAVPSLKADVDRVLYDHIG